MVSSNLEEPKINFNFKTDGHLQPEDSKNLLRLVKLSSIPADGSDGYGTGINFIIHENRYENGNRITNTIIIGIGFFK